MRELTGWTRIAIAIWAALAALFHPYGAVAGFIEPRAMCSLHPLFLLPLAFLLWPARPGRSPANRPSWPDVAVANPGFDEDMEFFARLASEGVRLFKVKAGFLSHAEDLRRMERLRRDLPADADLRIDYNQGLSAWDALAKVREMERFRPTFIEQPVPRDQRAALAAITAPIDTPIMADESVFSPAEAVEMVRTRLCDCVSIKIMKAGGIRRAREIAAIAEAAGIAGYGGNMFEGGIASAAGVHLVAATPNISLAAELYTSTYVMGIEVLATPIEIRNGRNVVPIPPGLGIEIDESVLARATAELRNQAAFRALVPRRPSRHHRHDGLRTRGRGNGLRRRRARRHDRDRQRHLSR